MHIQSTAGVHSYQRATKNAAPSGPIEASGFASMLFGAISAEEARRELDKSEIDWDAQHPGVRMFMLLHQTHGVDTSRTINLDSKGDQTLTDEQLAQLREKYNVENLSPQQFYDLMCDLTEWGVLSPEDIGSLYFRQPIFGGNYLVEAGTDYPFPTRMSTDDVDPSDFYTYMMLTVYNNNLEYDWMMRLGEKDEPTECEAKAYRDFLDRRDRVDSMMASHQKIFNILSAIKG